MKKDANGKRLTPKRIKGLNETFKKYRHHFVQYVSDSGEGVLGNAVHAALPCGCHVTGNGSIPFPLTVVQCSKHGGANG